MLFERVTCGRVLFQVFLITRCQPRFVVENYKLNNLHNSFSPVVLSFIKLLKQGRQNSLILPYQEAAERRQRRVRTQIAQISEAEDRGRGRIRATGRWTC